MSAIVDDDDSAPRFKYDKDGRCLERTLMNMPPETQTAIDTAALLADRTWDEQLAYIMAVCLDHQCQDPQDPKTREDWQRLFETIEFLPDPGDDGEGCSFVTVSIPVEIGRQMVEANPSIYAPALVEQVKQARALSKGVIPQFEDEPARMTFPIGLGSELAESVRADARAAGRTLAEQIEYEIEINHGWRFPDPGDSVFEERIRTSYTLREWVNLYLRFHVRFIKSAPRNAAHLLQNHLGPLLSITPSKLARASVLQWAQTIGRRHPATAMNIVIRLCSMYNKAAQWGLIDEGKNPAARCRLFVQQPRSRFLQTEEIARLLQTVDALPPRHATFFLTLLLTGCRMGEALKMQWGHLDLVQGVWYKPTTKTDSHTVPLPQPLRDRLLQLPKDHQFVFHGDPQHTGTKPGPWSRTAVFYHWRKIRRRAGFPDVHLHDLRRTTASWLASHGENIAVIQKVLNHAQLSTTQIYARMNMAPVRLALEANAERMLLLGPQAVIPPQPPVLADPPPAKAHDDLEMEWPG